MSLARFAHRRRGGGRRLRRVAGAPWVAGALWVAGSLGCASGAEHLAAARLEGVAMPAQVVDGTPLQVRGRGLLGARLALRTRGRTAAVDVTEPVEAPPREGGSPAWYRARVRDEGGAATEVSSLCDSDGDGSCVAAAATLGALPPLRLQALAPPPWTLGGDIACQAEGLPLAGEGVAWLEWRHDGVAMPSMPAAVTMAVASVDVTRQDGVAGVPHTVPAAPGLWSVRLGRRLGATAPSFSPPIVVSGAWRAPALAVSAPSGVPLSARRGRTLPLRCADCAGTLSADGCPAVAIDGTWDDGTVWPEASARRLPMRPVAAGGCEALLASPAFFEGQWHKRPVGALLVGRARIVGATGAVPILLRRDAATQVVRVRFDAGVEVGLWRHGLAAARQQWQGRVMELVTAHFAGLGVEIVAETEADVAEPMLLGVFGDDPHGLGLLGVEPTAGKDTGNLRRDERVDGLASEPGFPGALSWGGVYVGSFLAFSPTLQPGSLAADPAFDALFAPFAPELGGSPVTSGASLAAAGPAMEALAQLVAGTISHEIGHALGLAAGTDAYHHAQDNPGWRMDAGPQRPFGERAGLAPQAERWGPIDDAYLKANVPAGGL